MFLGSSESIHGYMLAVSPIETSRASKQYFNLDIETQDDIKSGICFFSSKRNLFAEIARMGWDASCPMSEPLIKENTIHFGLYCFKGVRSRIFES